MPANRLPLRVFPIRLLFAGTVVGLACSVSAQSLDDRLDEDRLLDGLTEFGLSEVLEHFSATHPSDDPVRRSLREIAALRLRMLDPLRDPAARLEIVDRVLDARARLLEAHPVDPRRAVWLADQASDLFFVLYPLDATWLTAEFGLPSPSQRDRAAFVAAEVNRLAAEAEIEIAETILNLESEPGYERDIALQLQRRRLSRDERDRRIPFLHGIGAYLHAVFNLEREADRLESLRLAVSLLEPLQRELDGGLRVRLRLYLGLAHARLGDVDEADEFFRAVVADEEATAAERFAARLGAVISREVDSGPEESLRALRVVEEQYRSADDLFFRILIADRRFLLLRAQAMMTAGAQREQSTVRAFSAYTDLLDADLGVPRDTVRTIIFNKLANAAGPEVPLEQLPPLVAVARAENLARDESTREQAIEMFERALERRDLDDVARASAIFGLARAHHDAGRHLDAAKRFEQVAREHPADRQSERAIEIAAALYVELHERDPGNQSVAERLDASLALMVERYPNLPNIHHWRSEAARRHLEQNRFTEARAMLEVIPPGSSAWIDSRFLLARIARAEALSYTDVSAARTAHRNLIETVDRVRPQVERARDHAVESSARALYGSYLARMDLFEAEARLELGSADEALERLDSLVQAVDLDPAVLGEALSLRIKVLQRLGRGGEALDDVREFMNRAPHEAGRVIPAMLRAVSGDVASLLDRGRTQEARQLAESDLLPLALALERWLDSSTMGTDDRLFLDLEIAEAFRLAARHDEALTRFDRVLDRRPDALQPLFGRAEALFGLGRYEEAMPIYRRIAEHHRERTDMHYWQSELRMLQILDRADTSERQKRQILPRILRLREQDESLGSDSLRRGFQELENKYRTFRSS